MLVIDTGRNISLTNGDSAELTITFSGDVPANGTTALLSVKKCLREHTCTIEKRSIINSGVVLFSFSSEETCDIKPGSYFWDIRLIYTDGSVITPFYPARFDIKEVVGDV